MFRLILSTFRKYCLKQCHQNSVYLAVSLFIIIMQKLRIEMFLRHCPISSKTNAYAYERLLLSFGM